MKPSNKTPNWGLMIEQLESKGLKRAEIGRAMGYQLLTDRMVRWFRNGMQPTHRRGEGLIDLWCSKMKRKRAQLPINLPEEAPV